MILREPLPYQEPQEILRRPRPLFVAHPRYKYPIFCFPAFSTGSPTTPYGISRPVVLDACRVITNHAANCQGDFLSTDIHGKNRLDIDDTPLDVDCYYFLGAPEVEENRDYPLVKTLSAFRFPSVLPPHWARIAQRRPPRPFRYGVPLVPSEMFDLVWHRDNGVCTITHYPDAAQCAYFIPKAEEVWFMACNMDDYIRGIIQRGTGIDRPENGMLLRADVRQCLDDHDFVFYPAASLSDSGSGSSSGSTGDNHDNHDNHDANDDANAFVAYFIGDAGYGHLPDLFHRRPVAIPQDVPVEFLYARFAHTVINIGMRDDVGFRTVPEMPEVVGIREWIRDMDRQRRRS